MRTLSTDSKILVSIILLTKNGEQYLRSLLESIHAQTGFDQAEVIVIDSGSTDGTLGIVADFPAVRVFEIPPKEFGHGKTRNFGARLARGEFLLYIPQDATPMSASWLERMLEPFQDLAVAGTFARQVARDEANPMERFFLSHTYHQNIEIKALNPGETVSLARCFFSTVSGAIRAAVWAKFPFREDIIMSEDQAWSRDVMRAGHLIVYQANAEVLHSHQYGVGDIFRRNFDSGFSVWQIFAGETGIGSGTVVRRLWEEGLYVFRIGKIKDRLLFIPYETARHVGFWLGMHGNLLPLKLAKAFSNLKYFWNDREESRKLALK